MSGIEFLPEAGGDETPEPDFRPTPHRRFSRAPRIAVAVVAAVALVGWVVTRPSEPSPRTQPQAVTTTTVEPSPSLPQRSSNPTVGAVIACEVDAPLRSDIARAVLKYLPGITIALALTQRCTTGAVAHPKVLSESVVGHYRKITIEVALSRRDAKFPDSYDAAPVNQGRAMQSWVETESAGIKIRVSSGGRGRWPTGFDIQKLADYLSLNTVL